MLREQILGKDRFDYAFKNYINQWAYKHPQPDDFFRSMENGAGEDLSWFWKGWFYNNWLIDIALIDAKYAGKDASKGITIKAVNKEQLPMPFTVEVKFKDGSKKRFYLPVETWLQSGQITCTLPTTQEAESVTIDPDNALPDLNRGNNSQQVK
ncbi:hypothetical protein ACFJIV_18220 [Mucilaginibacter sp. UC70_90]